MLQNEQAMITKDKVIEIFCIIDEFDKNLSVELSEKLRRKNAAPPYNRHCKRCAYAADGTRAPDPFHACCPSRLRPVRNDCPAERLDYGAAKVLRAET